MFHLVLTWVLILFSGVAAATTPRDIVFDIDQTIVYKIHGEPGGADDVLAPRGRVVRISYLRPGINADGTPLLDAQGVRVMTPVEESYRIYPGVEDLLQQIKNRASQGARFSFFSGGSMERNNALLAQIRLPDGTTALESAYQVRGEPDLRRVQDTGRYREMFRKPPELINADTNNVLMADDVDFMPDANKSSLVLLGEDFPYPERRSSVVPTPAMIEAEANKVYWASDRILGALDQAVADDTSLVNSYAARGGRGPGPFDPSQREVTARARLALASTPSCGSLELLRLLTAP